MNKNIRIAKELIKIAKQLCANDEQQQVEQVMNCIEQGKEMPSFVTNDPTVQKALQEIQQSSERIMRIASSHRSFKANMLKTIMDKARKLVPMIGLALALGFAGTAAAAEGIPQKEISNACQEVIVQFTPSKDSEAINSTVKLMENAKFSWKEISSKDKSRYFQGKAEVKDNNNNTIGILQVSIQIGNKNASGYSEEEIYCDYTCYLKSKDNKTTIHRGDNYAFKVEKSDDSTTEITNKDVKQALRLAPKEISRANYKSFAISYLKSL